MGETAISMRGLTKTYGRTTVVDEVDLEIRTGEVFALLGPNGAGKTTTVEILEAFRPRDSGRVEVLGVDPARSDGSWRARIGIVLQESGIYELQTVGETIDWYRAVYPNPMGSDEVLSLVDLADKVDQRAENLSGGQRRRLDVACGITGRPELLFLDEPTTGLDPEARRGVWELIRQLSESGTTIVLTTHYLDEVEALADRVGVLIGGRLVTVGPLEEFGGRDRGKAEIRFRLGPGQSLGSLPFMADEVTVKGEQVVIGTISPTTSMRDLLAWAEGQGYGELTDLELTRPTLEDLYLKLLASQPTAEEGVAK